MSSRNGAARSTICTTRFRSTAPKRSSKISCKKSRFCRPRSTKRAPVASTPAGSLRRTTPSSAHVATEEFQEPIEARKKGDATLDLLEVGKDELTPLEQFHIRFIRKSLEPGRLDSSLRFLQRHVGANWIEQSIKNLRSVRGLDRLPELDPK